MSGSVDTVVYRPCPPLPLEVWIEILGYLTDKEDLPTLWQSCRSVSHLLRVAAEKTYKYNCLGRWKLHLLLGYRRLPVRPGSNVERHSAVTSLIQFQRLSEDGERVFFHDPGMRPPRWGIDWYGGDLNLVARCMRRGNMDLAVGSGASIVGTLDVMLDIDDGDLPSIELEIDRKARTASYLWRPLLSTFLGNAVEGNPRSFYGTYGRKKPGRIVRGI